MKKLLFVLFTFCFALPSQAAHIIGGEMYYYNLGPGSAANTIKYRIVLKLYRETPFGAALDPSVNFAIYKTVNNSQYQVINGISLDGPHPVAYSVNDPCFGFQALNYEIGYYRTIVELPIDAKGYTVSFQRCCRRAGIVNLANSSSQGATYFATIPGTTSLAVAPQNTSPRFANRDSVIVCQNSPFSLDFSSVDDDGDSLVYYFCSGYQGGGQQQNSGCSGIIPNPSCGPPFTQINYAFPFSGSSPLGSLAGINSATGIISGISPNAGQYVVCVCVDEFRNGVKFNTHKKEFLITVKDCNIPNAKPPIDFTSCDGFTVNFINGSTGNITSNYWDFGVTTTNADTSIQASPTYTYTDTGVYHVMLVVNSESNCSDTGYTKVSVFPGFFAGFRSTGICKGAPIQFIDTTTTKYGFVDTWSWNFGDPTTSAPILRTHKIRPIVILIPELTLSLSSSRIVRVAGKTVTTTNHNHRSTNTYFAFQRFKLIVERIRLRLGAQASVPSTYSWTPLVNIINLNSQNPQVYPTVPTKYYVVADAGGCHGKRFGNS